MNEDDSTGSICDHCQQSIKVCECEIICQSCEDAMPRQHKCAGEARVCPYCDEPLDDCHCQPSGHYD